MRKLAAFALLVLFGMPCLAAQVSCGNPGSMVGTYKAFAEEGYAPNVLRLSYEGGKWHMELTSYWAPVPDDDGTRGTIGDFRGVLKVPFPWECEAILDMTEKDSDGVLVVSCVLTLTFDGPREVHIGGEGDCELFHGHRAVPWGTYKKNSAK
jgi:hypothetical protein